MNYKITTVIIATLLLLSSCAPDIEERQSDTLSYDTYKASIALDNGRVDIAKTIVSDMTLYVDPPKTSPKVYTINGYVILPDSYNKLKVVYYSDLLKDKSLEQELADEKKQAQKDLEEAQAQKKQDQEVHDELLKEVAQLKQDKADYQKSIFYKTYAFFHALSWWLPITAILAIGGLIALCVFCPAAIPIVINITEHVIVAIISLAWSIIQSIFNMISTLVTKKP